jgi:hypothetical protein
MTPILNIAHIIRHVMASAPEAELAALYINVCKAVCIRIILEELGHKQPRKFATVKFNPNKPRPWI